MSRETYRSVFDAELGSPSWAAYSISLVRDGLAYATVPDLFEAMEQAKEDSSGGALISVYNGSQLVAEYLLGVLTARQRSCS